MAMSLNFDTPQTSTPRIVNVTGTVAASSIAYLTIKLNVTNSATPTRNRSFYRVVPFNNTSSTALNVNSAYTLAIVPKLLGSDTVEAVAAWSYTPTAE